MNHNAKMQTTIEFDVWVAACVVIVVGEDEGNGIMGKSVMWINLAIGCILTKCIGFDVENHSKSFRRFTRKSFYSYRRSEQPILKSSVVSADYNRPFSYHYWSCIWIIECVEAPFSIGKLGSRKSTGSFVLKLERTYVMTESVDEGRCNGGCLTKAQTYKSHVRCLLFHFHSIVLVFTERV